MVKGVIVEPGKQAKIAEVDPSLDGLQNLVDGYIEVIYPFEDPSMCLVCNEEAKLRGMELNRALRDSRHAVYDIVAGPFVVLGTCRGREGEEFCGLTEEQANRARLAFLQPEMFIRLSRGGQILALTISEEEYAAGGRKIGGLL